MPGLDTSANWCESDRYPGAKGSYLATRARLGVACHLKDGVSTGEGCLEYSTASLGPVPFSGVQPAGGGGQPALH